MARPLLLFAPGAGAPSTSPWMTRFARGLGRAGQVVLLDYPYMLEGRRSPDKLAKLLEAHRHALRAARKGHRGPVILVGKSMGGRIGCHLALEEPVDGLVCLGYPLKGAGPKGKMRDAVLLGLENPVLFVQGTRDPLCPLALLRPVLDEMRARSELLVVESGNHSLEVTRGYQREHGTTQAEVEASIFRAVERFVASLRG